MARPEFEVAGSTVWATEEVVKYLKPVLEGSGRDVDKVQTVERHIGRFNKPEDIKRYLSNRDGCVRIAALGVREYKNQGGRTLGFIEFAAYVVTTDQFAYEKDQRCEVIANKLVIAMMRKGAVTEAYSGAERVQADNLYSDSIDDLGVAIWGVTWSQWFPVDVTLDESTLDDFIRFNFKAEIADGAPTLDGNVILEQEETHEDPSET